MIIWNDSKFAYKEFGKEGKLAAEVTSTAEVQTPNGVLSVRPGDKIVINARGNQFEVVRASVVESVKGTVKETVETVKETVTQPFKSSKKKGRKDASKSN